MFKLNPWIAIGLAAAWLISLGYVGYWQRGEGRALEENKWQAVLIQSQKLYSAKYAEIEARYRTEERKRATEAATLSAKYQKELKSHEAKSKQIIADLSAGYIRLRDNAVTCHAASGSGVSGTDSDSSRADGGTQGRLSPEFSGYLADRFADADGEVMLLNRCIAQLKADRGQ